MTGISTYNVSPQKAGLYFHKIQCFCFEEQRLLGGETIDMPVFFYIDPDFADDPKVRAAQPSPWAKLESGGRERALLTDGRRQHNHALLHFFQGAESRDG